MPAGFNFPLDPPENMFSGESKGNIKKESVKNLITIT